MISAMCTVTRISSSSRACRFCRLPRRRDAASTDSVCAGVLTPLRLADAPTSVDVDWFCGCWCSFLYHFNFAFFGVPRPDADDGGDGVPSRDDDAELEWPIMRPRPPSGDPGLLVELPPWWSWFSFISCDRIPLPPNRLRIPLLPIPSLPLLFAWLDDSFRCLCCCRFSCCCCSWWDVLLLAALEELLP